MSTHQERVTLGGRVYRVSRLNIGWLPWYRRIWEGYKARRRERQRLDRRYGKGNWGYHESELVIQPLPGEKKPDEK